MTRELEGGVPPMERAKELPAVYLARAMTRCSHAVT